MTARPFISFSLASLCLLTGCTTTQKLVPKWGAARMSDEEIDRQLSVARLGERHEQGSTAEKIYRKVLQQQEGNSTALHRLGVMAARDQRMDEAKDLLQQALKQDPDNVEILADLGYAYFLDDDLVQAEKILNDALVLDSRNERVNNNLGQVLAQQGKWEASLKHFRRSVDEAAAHSNLAFMQAQLGEVELAEMNYHHAVTIDPTSTPAGEGLLQLTSAKVRAEHAGQVRLAEMNAQTVKQAQFTMETPPAEAPSVATSPVETLSIEAPTAEAPSLATTPSLATPTAEKPTAETMPQESEVNAIPLDPMTFPSIPAIPQSWTEESEGTSKPSSASQGEVFFPFSG